ncbi:leucine-rich repeat-containing protein 43-like [Sphaeramia orbicularis]|uniref:leucine-rich repeat-containing protein 43-like n=1 Tax=Sphaeramia orbicularis TaxID=375764 RepID=UPI00117FF116|nr:leucine-rich repeat-containing protein 43 [Sphaeramia orbicularis]
MSSNTLSAVLEKLICRLCLNDFPCGFGSWYCTEGAETEETDALLDLLNCPHSPWRHDESWSPQAPSLRQLALISPERLHADLIYNYFTALRIIDKGVSIIDDGLVKFAKLEELVLSANKLTEIPAESLPPTLKVLELRDNWISSLSCLTKCPPPHLQYLGLGSNHLGFPDDVTHLTRKHWPQLVCLDLSDCEFQDHRALLNALRTLSCLRTLVLVGNPFTLAPSYPGFTVDTLPRLSCLDTSWISPAERHHFRGLAKMTDLIQDRALATVSVGRLRGISDPLISLDDFPVVTYSYFVTYDFFSLQIPAIQNTDSNSKMEAPCVMEADFNDGELQLNYDQEMKKPHVGTSAVKSGDTAYALVYDVYQTQSLMHFERIFCDANYIHAVPTEYESHSFSSVLQHSTSKLTWTECMDFRDTQTYVVSDLGGFKSFLNQGMSLRIEEEKVLSWPAAPEETKGGKGKEAPVKSSSIKDKSKDKKRRSVAELVHDTPIRRTVGSIHVPLQSLVKGGQKVDMLCDFGVLYAEAGVEAAQTPEKADLSAKKDSLKKIKEERKKEDKESKQHGGSGGQKTAAAKGYTITDTGSGRVNPSQVIHPSVERDADVQTENSTSIQLEPVTVELSVKLEKWQTASEAHQLPLPHETS